MPKQPPPSEDFDEADPPTLYGSTPGEALGPGQGEWALIRYVGEPIGEVLALREWSLTIGRSSECQLCLADAEVSRRHAKLDLVSQGEQSPIVFLSDLGSTNGTYVNGKRLQSRSGPIGLQNGDVLRVGAHAFKLKHLDQLERSYHEAVLLQTTVDALTGLGNRVSVLGFLEKHGDLARRHRRPLSLILCDLDHFKEVNDRFGHAVGDKVLRRFAQVVSGRLRASDHIGRIGGEEFLVVLPETGGREAQALAEQLRLAVIAADMEVPGQPEFRLTSCFGVAHCAEGELDGGSLLARADVALYRAKALGRDRVEYDGRS
jgi:diguanylate cyclase (GGDEF)-like protein